MAGTPKIKDLMYEIDRLKKENAALKTSKPYGLVWEDKPEQFDKDAQNALPVLRNKGGRFKDLELDAMGDHNVLIEGDNYHALSVLSYTHKGKVDVIYIDPPYNTGATDWKYNNDYVDYDDAFKHSKWLSFMDKRLRLARELLNDTGVLVCTIDHNEQENLGLLLKSIFASYEIVCVTIVHNPAGIQGYNFSYTHEYAYFVYPKGGRFIGLQQRDDNPDIRPLRNVSTGEVLRETAANCFYPIFVKDEKIVGFGDVCPDSFHPSGANVARADGVIEVYPIDPQGNERKWVFARQSVESITDELAVEFNKKRRIWDIIRRKSRFPFRTVWTGSRYSANNHGTQVLNQILDSGSFSFPKSIHAVRDCLTAALNDKTSAIVLDFFAGSGTTAQAVLELNQQDGGTRRFVLSTNNENKICEDVTYERLKRVMKGYTTPSGEKIEGLGGNLKYLKTDFVPKHVEYGLTDEARLDLTRRANLLLALKENTFTTIETADRYEIFSSTTRTTGVYFTEDKSDINTMLKALKKHGKDRVVTVYIFSWEKGAYKAGFEDYPDFHFEDIPEPILDVYRSIGY